MSRSVEEWRGKTDDTPVPPRVRLRILALFGSRCAICIRRIAPGDRWICDHKRAIINGGANRELNLQPICDWCDKTKKTPADVAEKSHVYDRALSHAGIRKQPKGRPMPGTKASGIRKRLNGTVERW